MSEDEKNPLLDALKSQEEIASPPSAARNDSEEGPEEKVEYQENGNRAEASWTSARIRTLEELIAECKIDLTVWEIERWLVNKWEGYRSGKTTNVVYGNGKIQDGEITDNGRLWIEPLWQVKVWLVRREPVALKPLVQPVEVKVVGRRRLTPTRRQKTSPALPLKGEGVKRALEAADPHFGYLQSFDGELTAFQDERALEVVLKVLEREHFDVVVLAGDLLDLAEWTDKYPRTPEHYWTTQKAVIRAAEWLTEVKQRCEKVIVMEGNHDERFKKLMIRHFIHAYDLRPADRLDEEPPMSVPNLLGLERMGIEYVGDYPNGRYMLNERVGFEHGDVARANPGHTASEVVRKAVISRGFGHVHRREMATRRISDLGITTTAFCPGCLCRVDGTVPGSKKTADWQQGFAVVEYLEEGEHAVSIYPIDEGRTIYKGQMVEAEAAMEREGES